MKGRTLLVVTSMALAACASSSGGAEAWSSFVTTLGSDTLNADVFRRTNDGFEGVWLEREPITRLATYRARLSPDGSMEELHVSWRTPDENPDPSQTVDLTVTIGADSVTVLREQSGQAATFGWAKEGQAVPFLGSWPQSDAIVAYMIDRTVASGVDSLVFQGIWTHDPEPSTLRTVVRRAGPDTVRISHLQPSFFLLDSDGRVTRRDFTASTLAIEVERVESLDIDALAAEFAARDARGLAMGRLSPGDTARASSNGSTIQVTYSRPAKRGREVWGGLVPWNEVWRTGANAATVITFDRDVSLRGTPVPAGSYSVFSVYTPTSAELILNRRTGQWGTQYDATQDVVRVALDRESVPTTVERFRIGLDPTAEGALLTLTWDDARYSVPIRVEGE